MAHESFEDEEIAEILNRHFVSIKVDKEERPISKAYRVMDNDLARDNVENDIPAADLQDI